MQEISSSDRTGRADAAIRQLFARGSSGSGRSWHWGRGLGSLLERGDRVVPVREFLHQLEGMAVYGDGVSGPSAAVHRAADWLGQRLNESRLSPT